MLDEMFKALSEEIRLRILSLLLDKSLCVCEIECSLKLTQSNASRHLGVLKNAKILESYKNAQWTYYRIKESFKTEQNGLWEYLITELPKISTYEDDIKAYEDCTKNNPCAKQNKGGI